MNRDDIVKMGQVWQSVIEKKKPADDKVEMDPVGQGDDDIDNDGDTDASDSYLKNRRKAIKKSKMDEAKTDGVAPGSLEKDGHLCASRIFKAGVGEGTPVMGEHAEPDEDGFISWYNVDFDNGVSGSVEMVDEDVVVLDEMSHGSHKKKKMKKESVEQVDEISQGMKNRYIQRAAMSTASNAHSDGVSKTGRDKLKHKDKVLNRLRGINRATKEEVEQDDEMIADGRQFKIPSNYTQMMANKKKKAARLATTDTQEKESQRAAHMKGQRSDGGYKESTDQEFVDDIAKAIVAEGIKKHHSTASAYVAMVEAAANDRVKHYKGAAKPEGHLDALPQSQKDFIKSLEKKADVTDEEEEIDKDSKDQKKGLSQSPTRRGEKRNSEKMDQPKDTTKANTP